MAWSQAKENIEAYSQSKWDSKWENDKRFKHTKWFLGKANKKAKGLIQLSTINLSVVIAGITGHNNLAYFQSKLDNNIDPTCRLCQQGAETLYLPFDDKL